MKKFRMTISILLIVILSASFLYSSELLEVKGTTDEINVLVFKDDNLNFIKDESENGMSNITVLVEYFKENSNKEDEDISVYDGYEIEEYKTDINGEVIFKPKNPLYSISIVTGEGENYGFIENKYFSIEKERDIKEHLFGTREIESIEIDDITTSEDELDYSLLKDAVKAFDSEGNLLTCEPLFETESNKQITKDEGLDLNEDSEENQKDIKAKKAKKIKVKSGKKTGTVKINKEDKVYKSVNEKLKDLKDKERISKKEYYKNLIYSLYDSSKLSKAATENVEKDTEHQACGTQTIHEIESYLIESNDIEIRNELNKYSLNEMQHKITDTYVSDFEIKDSINNSFKTMSLSNNSISSFAVTPLAEINDSYSWDGTNIPITVSYNTSGTHATTSEYAKKIVDAVKKSYDTYKGLGYRRPNSFTIYVRQLDDTYDGIARDVLNTIDIKKGLSDNVLYPVVAHEIFHSIQYKYNAVQPSFWLTEASATSMSKRVYPEYNFYTKYLSDLFNNMHNTLDCGEPNNQEYASAAFMFFLEEFYDTDIIRKIYENHKWTLIGGDRTVNVIDSTIKSLMYADGNTNGFAGAYQKFASYCYRPNIFIERGARDNWLPYPHITKDINDTGLKSAKEDSILDRMSARYYRFKTTSTAKRKITLYVTADYWRNIVDCHPKEKYLGSIGVGIVKFDNVSGSYIKSFYGNMNASDSYSKYIIISNYKAGGVDEFGLVLSNCNIDEPTQKILSFEVDSVSNK